MNNNKEHFFSVFGNSSLRTLVGTVFLSAASPPFLKWLCLQLANQFPYSVETIHAVPSLHPELGSKLYRYIHHSM